MEFACDEVAKIVAETMHNYMMFGRLLKCEYSQTVSQTETLWLSYNFGCAFVGGRVSKGTMHRVGVIQPRQFNSAKSELINPIF